MAVYYFCTEPNCAAGGVQVIYRHVDILNSNGIEAYVLHSKKGFRANWFPNRTPIVYLGHKAQMSLLRRVKNLFLTTTDPVVQISGGPYSAITPSDVLVVPEILGYATTTIGPGIPKVILNQNCYYSFKFYSLVNDGRATAYTHPDVIATLINSHDGEAYLRYIFSDIRLERFQLSINASLFYPGTEKKDLICYFPRKNIEDARQVVNILKARKGALGDFQLRPLDKLSQSEVADNLREAKIFLSFGYPEGFGLPAAEAMACGCVVAGYHGGGGREFFQSDFSRPIEVGDIIGFAKSVEDLIKLSREDPQSFESLGISAAAYIARNYSLEEEETTIVTIWKRLLEWKA